MLEVDSELADVLESIEEYTGSNESFLIDRLEIEKRGIANNVKKADEDHILIIRATAAESDLDSIHARASFKNVTLVS